MEDNEQLLNTISYNLNYEKIKELKINKYYYLYEFNKILIPNSSTYNVVRRSTLSIIISYSFIPYIILNLIGCIQFCSEKYLAVMWLFCICGIINISSLINSFFYPYKVDIPGKEIYIFEESFNDKIKQILEDKLNSKIYMVGTTLIIIICIIIHIILAQIFIKENKDNSIISALIDENKDKEEKIDKLNKI